MKIATIAALAVLSGSAMAQVTNEQLQWQIQQLQDNQWRQEQDQRLAEQARRHREEQRDYDRRRQSEIYVPQSSAVGGVGEALSRAARELDEQRRQQRGY